MRLLCAPKGFSATIVPEALRVVLYGQADDASDGSAGAAALKEFRRRKFEVPDRAWDLLSIALSVIAADSAGRRDQSPDGWTREFELDIAVADPDFWTAQAPTLQSTLAFMTTDRWAVRFHSGGLVEARPSMPERPTEDCVVLLSGGLDSLVGAIDLVSLGRRPYAVSQLVRGDAEKQEEFAKQLGLAHVQVNHNVSTPGVEETSQRTRSLIFVALGVLVGTSLRAHHDGGVVPLHVSENGYIALNPPLTGGRLGSHSTRTAHPDTLGGLQAVLDAAGLRVQLVNPYALKTKGEMLRECRNQELLQRLASTSTSCGRYLRHGYRHCGRCVPCQVRRAAFIAWAQPDKTDYVYRKLGKKDQEHARFDDVRSVAVALATVQAEGLDSWLTGALSSPRLTPPEAYRDMVDRALGELRALHTSLGIR